MCTCLYMKASTDNDGEVFGGVFQNRLYVWRAAVCQLPMRTLISRSLASVCVFAPARKSKGQTKHIILIILVPVFKSVIDLPPLLNVSKHTAQTVCSWASEIQMVLQPHLTPL